MLSGARIATLACFAVIATIEMLAAIDRQHVGMPGATLKPETATSNYRFLVTKAPRNDPLRSGDLIEISDPFDLAALQYRAFGLGSTLAVRRISPPPAEAVSEPIVATRGFRFGTVLVVLEAMFLSVAALVAARGRSSGSLSLAWLLALTVFLVNPITAAWPRWLSFGYSFASFSFAVLALCCAADFASRFAGDPQAPWARRYRGFTRAVGAGAIVLDSYQSFLSSFAAVTPLALQDAVAAGFAVQVMVFLVGLGLAYAKAPASDRQRVSWVAVSLGTGIVGFVISAGLQNAGISEPARDIPLLLLLAMPLGCAYAILRYRLLDIAFVVNRATVFGITSLLVLAALALVDFGLQTLLGSWLSRTGIYVQLGLALAIGISTRPIHERVDRLVDDLFFRQRHEAERALRRFAREVAYIDKTEVVLARTVETVERAAKLRCSLLLTDARGALTPADASASASALAPVDRNDGATVRLLATREPVDLHDVQSALTGDYAFPMFARNRLLGVLVCGGKLDGVAAYAPDELEAIGAVAHATGFALDLLRIEALERELAELQIAGVAFPSVVRRI